MRLWLRRLRNLLIGLLIAEGVGVIVLAVRPLPPLDGAARVEGTLELPPPSAAVPSLPSLARQTTRTVFGPAPGATTAIAQRGGIPSEAVTHLAARLSLVGIITGEPVQAIIQDTQTQRTYIVTVGQPVVTGVVVQDVGEGRVILDVAGERAELTL